MSMNPRELISSRCAKTAFAGWLALCTLCAMLTGTAEAAQPPAAEWLPADTLLVLEVSQPDQLLDAALQERVLKMIQQSPQYQQQTETEGFRHVRNVVQYFEQQQGSDWETLIRRLVGGGVTAAVGPEEAVWLIVDCADEKLLRDIHEFFLMIARTEAEKAGHPERVVSAEYRGVEGWRFGAKGIHALIGDRLVVSNKPENLKTLLDLRAGEGGKSLATVTSYQTARQHLQEDSGASLYVNTGVLKHVPNISQVLQANINPMVTLLFEPWLAAFRDSSWALVEISLLGERIQLKVATDGAPEDSESPSGFAWTKDAGGGPLPQLKVPRQIATASLYRDLHHFYGAKDELFPERTSGMIFFENMMGIFFTGRNLTEEVLAQLGPEVRLVVAAQQYDGADGTPRVQVPGFAIVFRMRNAEEFAPVVEEAWQKAIGFINFTRGQQAQPGLIIDRPTYAGAKYTLSYFSEAGASAAGENDARFNFRPVLAMPGDYLVLSSSEGLARDLIDALKQEAEGTLDRLTNMHTFLSLDGLQLATILETNRESLVRNNMVKEGNSREETEQAIGVMLRIAQAIRSLELAGGGSDGQSVSTLAVEAELPE